MISQLPSLETHKARPFCGKVSLFYCKSFNAILINKTFVDPDDISTPDLYSL